jgi:hypothetical protein
MRERSESTARAVEIEMAALAAVQVERAERQRPYR